MNYGEIIELGKHRLMCGDATSREDVMRLIGNDNVNLVLTDPPYGIRVQSHCKGSRISSNGRSYPPLIGDKSSDTARLFYPIASTLTDNLIFWGGNYFTDFLPVSGGWLVWDKCKHGLSFSDCELAWKSSGTRITLYRQKWNGFIFDGAKNLNQRIHPTQKPVELHMRILEDFSQSDDVILDCLGGSGTTLIACEMTGRKCLMMELSPEYCDVNSERYMKLKDDYPIEY